MQLLVRCPECHQTMKYNPDISHIAEISDKAKRCVYCGRSFKVHPSPDKSRVVKQLD